MHHINFTSQEQEEEEQPQPAAIQMMEEKSETSIIKTWQPTVQEAIALKQGESFASLFLTFDQNGHQNPI